MPHPIAQRLIDLGIVLPETSAAAGNYLPFVIAGPMLSISGQLPLRDGSIAFAGHLGKDISEDQGYQAARLCGQHILSQVCFALHGNWARLLRCVQLSVFVQSTSDFCHHPMVANGVSDFMVEVLGADVGKHARAAVGCSSLPKGAAVEVSALFLIEA